MTIASRKSKTAARTVPASRPRYVVCVQNEGYAASLEKRKIYRVQHNAAGAAHGLLRVIDESGEDYLCPADWFVPISLSLSVARALSLAA